MLARHHQERLEESQPYLSDFYHRAGFDEALMALIPERCESYPARISTPPAHFTRLLEGEELRLGESDWTIWIGRGHSPEHACLYNAAHNVIISGDQLLPKISPNVAIWPTEPTADPLQLFLQSLHLFYDVDPSCLVLPSHDHPFYGAAQRAQVLARHHQERLEENWRKRWLCAGVQKQRLRS